MKSGINKGKYENNNDTGECSKNFSIDNINFGIYLKSKSNLRKLILQKGSDEFK